METFLTIVFFVSILAIALLWRAREKESPGRSSTSVKKPPSGGVTVVPPVIPAPDAASLPDPQGEGPKGTLRKSLRDNIGGIFPGEGEPSRNCSAPLAYEDVKKDVMDEVMAEVKALKSFRTDHRRLQKILNDQALQIGSELSKMVTSDPVLTIKILNTVNSPYYGLPQKVDSIGHAMLLLGIVRLREILYRNGLLNLFRTEDPFQNDIVENLWKHATLTSICASHLHRLYSDLDRGTLFTMGLLHDVGKLILLKWVGVERYPRNLTIGEEEAIVGINHEIIGRMALETWGFSDLMVSVIEQHHAPSFCELKDLDMDGQRKKYLIVLFFADQLAKLILNGEKADNVEPFLSSYLPMIDRQRFLDISIDDVLLSSITQSEVFAEGG
ncbi:MAG: HDOD domain-containing protein [Deltaproteobacteria bacterium]|nr:HDOD domain-containing protein [Deltaproteobacteria bacterium]